MITLENKINILETLLIITKQNEEFQQEETTGNDLVMNAEIWLNELKSYKNYLTNDKFKQ